jgi:hypothetical protein
MGFPRGRLQGPARRRSTAPVFAVGRRAYVGPVTLTDETGKTARETLRDGTEVAILAWQPSGDATRYQVRATESGVEGWVLVGGLRNTAVAVPPDAAASPPTAGHVATGLSATGRPFGAR